MTKYTVCSMKYLPWRPAHIFITLSNYMDVGLCQILIKFCVTHS